MTNTEIKIIALIFTKFKVGSLILVSANSQKFQKRLCLESYIKNLVSIFKHMLKIIPADDFTLLNRIFKTLLDFSSDARIEFSLAAKTTSDLNDTMLIRLCVLSTKNFKNLFENVFFLMFVFVTFEFLGI